MTVPQSFLLIPKLHAWQGVPLSGVVCVLLFPRGQSAVVPLQRCQVSPGASCWGRRLSIGPVTGGIDLAHLVKVHSAVSDRLSGFPGWGCESHIPSVPSLCFIASLPGLCWDQQLAVALGPVSPEAHVLGEHKFSGVCQTTCKEVRARPSLPNPIPWAGVLLLRYLPTALQ